MTAFPRRFALAALAAALVSLVAAAHPQDDGRSRGKPANPTLAPSADIPRSQAQRRLELTAAQAVAMQGAGATKVTDADVGDVDSFGRELHWLGVADMRVELTPGPCPPPYPGLGCQPLAPAPAVTSFSFQDLGHIALPKKAAHSLLCYWFSPYLAIDYHNPTAVPVVATLEYFPTLTVENPVLDDPTLIDATTGLPFNGSLLTGMTASEVLRTTVPAGAGFHQRTRDSAVCIAGFVTREALVNVYGLTDAQAKAFFKQPTTVRLNISGSAQYVDYASLYFGFRIIGD